MRPTIEPVGTRRTSRPRMPLLGVRTNDRFWHWQLPRSRKVVISDTVPFKEGLSGLVATATFSERLRHRPCRPAIGDAQPHLAADQWLETPHQLSGGILVAGANAP